MRYTTSFTKCICLLALCMMLIDSAEAQSLSLDPIQTWKSVEDPGPFPEINFRLNTHPVPAGDINGDGKQDYIIQATHVSSSSILTVADERTPDLSDRIGKTAVFFGGEASTTPNQLVYSYLIPAGDMNNDGYTDAISNNGKGMLSYYQGSPSGYQATGESHNQWPERLIPSYDLDGDGYQDALLYDRNIDSLTVAWGASSLSAISYTTYPTLVDTTFSVITIGNSNLDGAPEVIVNSGGRGIDPELAIFRFDPERNLIERQRFSYEDDTFSVPRSNCTLSLEDLDGVEGKELFILCFANDIEIFTIDSLGVYASRPIMDELSNRAFYPAGDLNGDTIVDWIRKSPNVNGNPGRATLYYGPILQNGSFSLLFSNYSLDELVPSEGKFGDIDGDGIDDALLLEEANPTFSRVTLLGQLNTDPVMDLTEYNYDDFPYQTIRYTTDLGDINGDGWPDFGFGYESQFFESPHNRFDVYFGDTNLPELPAFSIGRTDHIVQSVASGDFNADGFNDLVVGYVFENGATDGAFEFYAGGPNIDNIPDQEWSFRSLKPPVPGDTPDRGNVINAGDINGDGTSDFIMALLSNSDAYIVFGGESLSSEPDLIIDPARGGFYGMNMLKAGDLNDDGIDDFTITDFIDRVNPNGVNGSVYVYFGNVNPDDIAEPAFILNPDRIDGITMSSFGFKATAGDYNGDGVQDLVLGPATHTFGRGFGNEEEGSNAVFVYYGGTNMDDQPDVQFSLPRRYFGLDLPGYINFSAGEYTFVPDLNSDGKQELMIASFDARYRDLDAVPDAFILPGGAMQDTEPLITLRAPNRYFGMGSFLNSFYRSLYHTAMNDYDMDGTVDVLIPQYHDNNDGLRTSRVYRFALPMTSGTDIDSETPRGPIDFSLHQNYPNPASNETTIAFSIPKSSQVKIKVYDTLGRMKSMLVDGTYTAGQHTISLDTSSWPNGLYMYVMQAGGKQWSKQFIVIR